VFASRNAATAESIQATGTESMTRGEWEREGEARLVLSGMRGKADNRPECIHCGQKFDPLLSSGGEHGLCQYCMDIE